MPKKMQGNISAKKIRIAIVISRFNEFISNKLKEGAIDCIMRHDGEDENITEIYVPGSFEIPLTAKKAASSGLYDAVICLGAIIRGDTPHFDMVANETTKGIAMAGFETGIPVIYGVLTTDTIEQAIERAGTKSGNKGWDAAISAMEMVNLFTKLS